MQQACSRGDQGGYGGYSGSGTTVASLIFGSTLRDLCPFLCSCGHADMTLAWACWSRCARNASTINTQSQEPYALVPKLLVNATCTRGEQGGYGGYSGSATVASLTFGTISRALLLLLGAAKPSSQLVVQEA